MSSADPMRTSAASPRFWPASATWPADASMPVTSNPISRIRPTYQPCPQPTSSPRRPLVRSWGSWGHWPERRQAIAHHRRLAGEERLPTGGGNLDVVGIGQLVEVA